MLKKQYQQIAGIAVALLLIVTSVGTTIYLKETNKYINCRADWEEQDDGKYLCPKTNETEWCYRIEYRGAGWYRCWIGEPVEIEEELIIKQVSSAHSGRVHTNSEGCMDC